MANGTVYIYSNGQVIAEYDGAASVNQPSREYIFGRQNRIATVVGSTGGSGGTITYEHRDHLSPRLFTNANGTFLGEQGTYPFGEVWYNSNGGSNWIFTTYERDEGEDYAIARTYSSGMERFDSPDPVEGDPADPQSWNRYTYTRNDPINITDPSGQNWAGDLLNTLINIAAQFGSLGTDAGNFGDISISGPPCGGTTLCYNPQSSAVAPLLVVAKSRCSWSEPPTARQK